MTEDRGSRVIFQTSKGMHWQASAWPACQELCIIEKHLIQTGILTNKPDPDLMKGLSLLFVVSSNVDLPALKVLSER